MKLSSVLLVLACLCFSPLVSSAPALTSLFARNAPVTVEISTNYSDRAEALEAAKKALSAEQFEIDGSMGERGFMARRTTDSEDVYYVGDISTSERDGKVVLTIVLIQFGEGDVDLEAVGKRLEEKLG